MVWFSSTSRVYTCTLSNIFLATFGSALLLVAQQRIKQLSKADGRRETAKATGPGQWVTDLLFFFKQLNLGRIFWLSLAMSFGLCFLIGGVVRQVTLERLILIESWTNVRSRTKSPLLKIAFSSVLIGSLRAKFSKSDNYDNDDDLNDDDSNIDDKEKGNDNSSSVCFSTISVNRPSEDESTGAEPVNIPDRTIVDDVQVNDNLSILCDVYDNGNDDDEICRSKW